jgi:hypothetical protein
MWLIMNGLLNYDFTRSLEKYAMFLTNLRSTFQSRPIELEQ